VKWISIMLLISTNLKGDGELILTPEIISKETSEFKVLLNAKNPCKLNNLLRMISISKDVYIWGSLVNSTNRLEMVNDLKKLKNIDEYFKINDDKDITYKDIENALNQWYIQRCYRKLE
jgi:hypothetical protein